MTVHLAFLFLSVPLVAVIVLLARQWPSALWAWLVLAPLNVLFTRKPVA
ncbi:MAG TPA: hypothetical protein VMP00_10990 [Burkholderiales bacterium]|nr:hypothetical protein [Burkholderiales bacterium]